MELKLVSKYLKGGEIVLVNGKWNIFVPDGFGDENCLVFESARQLLTYLKG